MQSRQKTIDLGQKYAALTERLLDKPYSRVQFDFDYFLGGVDVKGARCLDIGAGAGFLSAYLLVRGAQSVTAIEPELDGSSEGFLRNFRNLIDELGVGDRLTLVTEDFLTANLEPGQFDLVVSQDSINHIREVTGDIRTDPEAQRVTRPVLRQVGRMLRPGGRFVFSDCARHNFCSERGMFRGRDYCGRRIDMIEWDKHQDPAGWALLLRQEGFDSTRVRWWTPYRTRQCPWIFGNRLVNYLTVSYFYMAATRGTRALAD